MNREILPYKEALALKELGFDEITDYVYLSENNLKQNSGFANFPKEIYPDSVNTPFWQQIFRWFREKYYRFTYPEFVLTGDSKGVRFHIVNSSHITIYSKWCETYEEAELECLMKLIEIVAAKNNKL